MNNFKAGDKVIFRCPPVLSQARAGSGCNKHLYYETRHIFTYLNASNGTDTHILSLPNGYKSDVFEAVGSELAIVRKPIIIL